MCLSFRHGFLVDLMVCAALYSVLPPGFFWYFKKKVDANVIF